MPESDIEIEAIDKTDESPPKRLGRPPGTKNSNKAVRSRRNPLQTIPLKDEIVEKAHADYMTGNFTSVQLAEKYGGKRGQYWWYVRTFWIKELTSLGIPIPQEPKVPRKYFNDDFWKRVYADYLRGASLPILCARYNIHRSMLERRMQDEQWPNNRTDMIVAVKQQISTGLVNRGKILEGKLAKFIDSATDRLQSMIDKLEDHEATNDVKEFALVAKSLASICQSMKSLYQTEGGNGIPSTEGAGRTNSDSVPKGLIRINVMDGAKLQISAHDPAPVLKVS